MNSFCRTARLLKNVAQIQKCSPLTARHMSSNAAGLSMVCEGDIAIITMDKQDNRLNKDFCNEYHDLLDQVDGNDSIKGIITTGKGKFFSNGLDMEWMGTLPCQDIMDFMKLFQYTVKRVLVSPVPTLAALNGHTFAGGAVMAFAQDFRVMNAEKGWICFNEVHLSKTFYEFLASFLSCKIGSGLNLNDALVYGRRYTADEALSSQLIHSKAASSDLLEHSIKLLKSYVGKDGLNRSAIRNVKEHLYKGSLTTYDLHKNDIGFSKQFMNDSQLAELKDLKL